MMDRVASAERKADCASLICDLVQYAPAENVRLYALQDDIGSFDSYCGR